MKKVIIGFVLFFCVLQYTKAIKVKFMVTNMSVNIAEGDIGVFTAFEIYPNSFVQEDSTDIIELVDFSNILMEDIYAISIERSALSSDNGVSFHEINNFIVEDTFAINGYSDFDIIQGETYVYRLVVTLNNNQKNNLFNKSISTQYANPTLNCAKLNNVYRKSCHNCFQESIVHPFFGGFYTALYYTRVVELDIWNSNTNGSQWNVRHNPVSGGSDNNCGYGTTGDKPFFWCLNDINNWHNANPNHDPIILHIDLKRDFSPTHTALLLDNKLKTILGDQNIYKPRDLLGNNFHDIRVAAQQNNWPSMGDLAGKFIIVMTGDGDKVSQYIANRSLGAVAFSAAKVDNIFDVLFLPTIWNGLKNDIVFYNMQHFCDVFFNFQCGSDADLNTGYVTSTLGYINRSYGIGWAGQPGNYSNSDYNEAINFNMNNIAVANITASFNPNNRPVNGIQWLPDVTYPGLVNNHIYSNYQNVTQAAIQNIVATDLIVEPDAHYRMIAGNTIDLKPGVDFKAGSDVDVRIDDCTGADYSMRKANNNTLTPEEIAAIMHELNKNLYGYVPQDEEKIERLMVYPNPTNNEFTISYRNYLLNQATLTIYDITGRTVKTQTYQPTREGLQNFIVDVKSLKEGTYFYTLQVGNQTKNGKVVKVK